MEAWQGREGLRGGLARVVGGRAFGLRGQQADVGGVVGGVVVRGGRGRRAIRLARALKAWASVG
ncbi:hypothetical protein B1218_34225 [Pseudomonas ogarae]|nr:hypothetical protein B1218_34225 [Pseudomonas ogarae]